MECICEHVRRHSQRMSEPDRLLRRRMEPTVIASQSTFSLSAAIFAQEVPAENEQKGDEVCVDVAFEHCA